MSDSENNCGSFSSCSDYSDDDFEIQPYRYEPIAVSGNDEQNNEDLFHDIQAVDIADRIGNTDW